MVLQAKPTAAVIWGFVTDENMNSMAIAEVENIWMPILVFENTQFRPQADFRNKSASASIKINPGN